MSFVHLHTHSHYSLLDGLAKIPELVGRAKQLGMPALAVTDHGNLYGAVEFYKTATAAGVKPIFGVEAYVCPNGMHEKRPKIDDTYFHLILLAENEAGFRNLLKLVTHSHLDGFYYKPRMDKALLRAHHEGLIALSACLNGEVSQALLHNTTEEAERIAREYEAIFGKGNYFLELGHHPGIPETIKANAGLIALSKKTGIPVVATQDIHYLVREDTHYHDIFLAIQTGNKITDEGRLTLTADDFSMNTPEEMAAHFTDTPEAISNTLAIAERCNVTLQLGQSLLPNFSLPEGESSSVEYLKKLVEARLQERYPIITPQVRERLAYEMGVIEKTGFADYFLIVQDFVTWAKMRGVVVGPGRGSAAGSLVSYVLGITDIDPLQYDLLFERFLNPERIQMPDIDIDFTDVRRDEVLSYIREKYGDDKVAQIITFGTLAARAAIRDAGRALGVSYGFCDMLAKLIPFNQKIDEAIKNVPEINDLYEKNDDAKNILNAAKRLEGVVRHASVHACGIVISKDPLTQRVPLQRSPQDPNSVITQFEMHSIEDLGLLKMDLLGLKNLTIIENTVRLVDTMRGEKIDIAKIPLDDAPTYALFQQAETTGFFQFESAGMRRYLKELKPTQFEDIIAMVALYRPGPMELIPSFINRKHGKEKITYLHPKLEPILRNTYGIGVYQEQMMRIARDLAGFSLAEADTLRKAIGKKIKALLDTQQEKLVKGMIAHGIDAKTAQVIWDLFPPFARYGFNKSHAACYALIAYRTGYLRAHYPIEFVTSLLNADSGDTERISFLIAEAKKAGIAVLPPDITTSFTDFTPEGTNIRFGLLAIKNLGANIVEAIITERGRGGPFKDFFDMISRVKHKDLNKKSLESMTKAGVFDSFNIDRGTILANMDDVLAFVTGARKNGETSQAGLFGVSYSQSSPAPLQKKFQEHPSLIPAKEKLAWEKELLGLYISGHPLDSYTAKFQDDRIKGIKGLLATKKYFNNGAIIAGVLSQVKKIVSKAGQPMLFAKLEDMSAQIEILAFSDLLNKRPEIWKEGNVIIVKGRLTSRNNEPKFVCEEAKEL